MRRGETSPTSQPHPFVSILIYTFYWNYGSQTSQLSTDNPRFQPSVPAKSRFSALCPDLFLLINILNIPVFHSQPSIKKKKKKYGRERGTDKKKSRYPGFRKIKSGTTNWNRLLYFSISHASCVGTTSHLFQCIRVHRAFVSGLFPLNKIISSSRLQTPVNFLAYFQGWSCSPLFDISKWRINSFLQIGLPVFRWSVHNSKTAYPIHNPSDYDYD